MLLSRAACSFFAIAVIAAGAVRADEKERLMFRPNLQRHTPRAIRMKG